MLSLVAPIIFQFANILNISESFGLGGKLRGENRCIRCQGRLFLSGTQVKRPCFLFMLNAPNIPEVFKHAGLILFSKKFKYLLECVAAGWNVIFLIGGEHMCLDGGLNLP